MNPIHIDRMILNKIGDNGESISTSALEPDWHGIAADTEDGCVVFFPSVTVDELRREPCVSSQASLQGSC